MKLKVTQIKSGIGRKEDQKRTLKALGLKGIGSSVEQEDSPAIKGMLFKIKHLVEIEEL